MFSTCLKAVNTRTHVYVCCGLLHIKVLIITIKTMLTIKLEYYNYMHRLHVMAFHRNFSTAWLRLPHRRLIKLFHEPSTLHLPLDEGGFAEQIYQLRYCTTKKTIIDWCQLFASKWKVDGVNIQTVSHLNTTIILWKRMRFTEVQLVWRCSVF